VLIKIVEEIWVEWKNKGSEEYELKGGGKGIMKSLSV
jgi:hypothetical protein